MTVNQRLKQTRKYLDISQEKLARMLDLSSSTIINYEKGKSVPSIKELKVLNEVYPKLNLHWLITGDGKMLKEEETGFIAAAPYYLKDSSELSYDSNHALMHYGALINEVIELRKRIKKLENKIVGK